MERQDFASAIIEIYGFFQRKLPAEDIISRWFVKVKDIPTQNLPYITDRIEDYEKLPSNIPRAFNAEYSSSRRGRGPISYDPVEDLKFPVKYLYDAHEILEMQGNQAFIGFCDKVKMPQTDRERVLNKYNKVFDMGKLKAMLESIGERIPDLPTESDKINEARRQRMELEDQIPF